MLAIRHIDSRTKSSTHFTARPSEIKIDNINNILTVGNVPLKQGDPFYFLHYKHSNPKPTRDFVALIAGKFLNTIKTEQGLRLNYLNLNGAQKQITVGYTDHILTRGQFQGFVCVFSQTSDKLIKMLHAIR